MNIIRASEMVSNFVYRHSKQEPTAGHFCKIKKQIFITETTDGFKTTAEHREIHEKCSFLKPTITKNKKRLLIKLKGER